MTKIGVRYYRVAKGRGFWEPTAAMRKLGFQPVPCGKDCPDAWRIAEEWNARVDAVRRGDATSPATLSAASKLALGEEATYYPPGSFGDTFRRFRRFDEWARKAPRTRDDYWRAWRYIKPVFGDVRPASITLAEFDPFYTHVSTKAGIREAHRVVKCWRALWKRFAAMGVCAAGADPALGVTNTAAPPRAATWTEGEVARLVKGAWRLGFHGLAALLTVAYDTAFSPIDVRTLTAAQRSRRGGLTCFDVSRAKSGRAAIGTLSRRGARVLDAYLATLGVDLVGAAPIFRNRSGTPYTKSAFNDDFADVRRDVFGSRERRQPQDLRRTAAVEAFAGGASGGQVAAKMANTIGSANAIHKTYSPVDIGQVRAADEARRVGRKHIRDGTEKAQESEPPGAASRNRLNGEKG